jgi:hypothetical protein
MVPHNTVVATTAEKNVIKEATKKHKDKLYFEQEGINEANVIQGKGTDNEIIIYYIFLSDYLYFCKKRYGTQ